MKLVRLTNQTSATAMAMRSIHHGRSAKIRNSSGRLATTRPTASAWSSSRGPTAMGRMSSTAPTNATKAAEARTDRERRPARAPAETSRRGLRHRPRQAWPRSRRCRPLGVGVRCDERVFGCASATRRRPAAAAGECRREQKGPRDDHTELGGVWHYVSWYAIARTARKARMPLAALSAEAAIEINRLPTDRGCRDTALQPAAAPPRP